MSQRWRWSWRWSWRRPAWVDGQARTETGFRSRAGWSDLTTYPDAVLAQAAEIAAGQAAELAMLERVLNEPTTTLERVVRVPPFVTAYRRAGRWQVRHA